MVVEVDPVTDGARRVLDAVEALAVDALFLQRPDDSLDHAVLLGAMRRDELLLQAIAADQGEADRLADVIDAHLAQNEWFAGNDYTTADIAHFGWFWRREFAGVSFDNRQIVTF